MPPLDFSLTSALVLAGVLIVGLGLILFYSWLELRRAQKKLDNTYPSTKKKYPKEVERVFDETEAFYHN